MERTGNSRVVPMSVGIWPLKTVVMVVELEYLEYRGGGTYWLPATEKDLEWEYQHTEGSIIDSVIKNKPEKFGRPSVGVLQSIIGVVSMKWSSLRPIDPVPVHMLGDIVRATGALISIAESLQEQLSAEKRNER